MNLKFIVYPIISYFIGCFCAAYYYGIIFKNTDLRKFGSGNLGATNSGRVFGSNVFIIVLLGDFFKGAIVVIIGRFLNFSNISIMIAMFAVIIGHIFPIQLKFKGGKGVATFIGVLTAYNYLYSIILAIIFLLSYMIIRRFTISGLVSIALLPIILFLSNYPLSGSDAVKLLPFICIIIIKHKENILSSRK